MKTIIFFVLTLLVICSVNAQQETESGRYKLRMKLASQDTVYMKIGKDTVLLKKGWVISETKAGKSIQRILENDTLIIQKKEIPVKVTINWKIGEVKHSDDAPNKLILNPYFFSNPKDSLLNNQSYLKIPANGYVTLIRSYWKWNAITIPFAIRPSLNDTIGSKITTDLKIGASISYNINREIFKNRRIKANKSIYGISGGLGFGFSKVTLDKSSTSLLENPYENSEDGLAFFIAPGIGLNLKGFQINFSYGWDLPITSNVKDWNYSKKGYFGLGLGIGLDVFGKI
jgi:hypothetical protein